ncbi:MAG: hypothetical protein DMG12_11920, partial [Acidobacteria bacterium]
MLAIVVLLLQGSVSSAVETGIVTGQILSNDGGPLSGVSVLVMVRGVQDGRAQLTPIGVSVPGTIAQTDGQGQYRLANIPPGKYYIVAQAPAVGNSGEPTSRNGDVINLPTLYPGVSTLDDAKRIDVTPGSEVHLIDFSIIRGRGMRVRGQVFDATTGS